jgi:hypothetical protein
VQLFAFGGWGPPRERPQGVKVEVLTPATSVSALTNGFTPRLHPTAIENQTSTTACAAYACVGTPWA